MNGNAPAVSAPYPNRDAVIRHLAWLCVPAFEHLLRLEIAWGAPATGPRYAKTYFISRLAEAADFACWINQRGNNVYVGSTLKRPDTPEKGRTTGDQAVMATCLPIDIDTGFTATAEKFVSVAKPQVLVVTGTVPETRGQLFARIEPTTDLAAWEQLHGAIVKHCGGDVGALGRNRLMRLGGTVSYPSPTKAARGYITERTQLIFIEAPVYPILSLKASIPAFPPPVAASGHIALAATSPTLSRSIKPPIGAVQAALRTLPQCYADERSLWIKIGFALHDFDGGAVGLSLWEIFSRRCPHKAKATDFQALWQGFVRPSSKRSLSIDWLLSEARQQRRKSTASSV